MSKFVNDKNANQQILKIYGMVQAGSNDAEIAIKLNELGIKNLKKDNGQWDPLDIKNLREQFKLDTDNPVTIKDIPLNSSVDNKAQNVVVTDIQMPFESMVFFMIKWAIATIPAVIILAILVGIIFALFTAL